MHIDLDLNADIYIRYPTPLVSIPSSADYGWSYELLINMACSW